MVVSFEEYNLLPKKAATKNLVSGKMYYIQDTKRRAQKYITVYIGKYRDTENNFYMFTDVEYVVAPSGTSGKPHGFSSKGNKFMEVISVSPTKTDIRRKNSNLQELNDFIVEKQYEPHDKPPKISFFGVGYRKTKKNFSKLKKNKSSRSSRSSRSSNSSRSSSSRKKRNTMTRSKSISKSK